MFEEPDVYKNLGVGELNNWEILKRWGNLRVSLKIFDKLLGGERLN